MNQSEPPNQLSAGCHAVGGKAGLRVISARVGHTAQMPATTLCTLMAFSRTRGISTDFPPLTRATAGSTPSSWPANGSHGHATIAPTTSFQALQTTTSSP